MRLFISDISKEAEVCIYDSSNKECTKEFIEKYFIGEGIEYIPEELRDKDHPVCPYIVTKKIYEYLIKSLEEVQKCIDEGARNKR